MSIKSQEKTILLRQLFSGRERERRQALRSVEPQHREGVLQLAKARQNSEHLFKVMVSDLQFVGGQLRSHPGNQFWRRTAIRALAATVDGTIFGLKELAVATNGLLGQKLVDEEIEFLREQKSGPGKLRLLPFRDNFKRTFKLFAKVYGITCPVDFGQKGFEAVCETFELRHRVTHPKSFMTFCVQDGEMKRAGESLDWLHSALNALLEVSGSAIGKLDT